MFIGFLTATIWSWSSNRFDEKNRKGFLLLCFAIWRVVGLSRLTITEKGRGQYSCWSSLEEWGCEYSADGRWKGGRVCWGRRWIRDRGDALYSLYMPQSNTVSTVNFTYKTENFHSPYLVSFVKIATCFSRSGLITGRSLSLNYCLTTRLLFFFRSFFSICVKHLFFPVQDFKFPYYSAPAAGKEE